MPNTPRLPRLFAFAVACTALGAPPALAHRAAIPVQVGTTNGGNDDAEFARAGAVDVPLSWPGRYSHSPVEVCDLRDLLALARLISALALAPSPPSPR